MKRPTILALATAASLSGACSASVKSVAPTLPPAPADLAAPCQTPAGLPAGSLTQSDVERLWLADRLGLIDCGAQVEGWLGFYEGLRGGVTG